LFYQATRIINELKPAYCLFENVPGLLSSDDGRDFARVLMEMARIGYHGAWRVLDAQWLGVAQRRRRVFGLFTCLDSGAERCAEILSLQESLRGHPAPSREAGEGVAPILEAGARTGVSTTDPRAGSGIGDVGDPMYTLQAGKCHAVAGTLDRKSCGANRGRQANETEFVAIADVVHGDKACNGKGWNADGSAYTLDTMGTQGVMVPAVAGCLAAGAHPGSYNGQDAHNDMLIPVKGADSDAKPGHLVPVFGIDEEQNAAEKQALRAGAEVNYQFAQIGMQVRRLTPTECERLQGFPDGWTAGFSDSTRYKMLGNAVCVNVAEWIAGRMANASGETRRGE